LSLYIVCEEGTATRIARTLTAIVEGDSERAIHVVKQKEFFEDEWAG